MHGLFLFQVLQIASGGRGKQAPFWAVYIHPAGGYQLRGELVQGKTEDIKNIDLGGIFKGGGGGGAEVSGVLPITIL